MRMIVGLNRNFNIRLIIRFNIPHVRIFCIAWVRSCVRMLSASLSTPPMLCGGHNRSEPYAIMCSLALRAFRTPRYMSSEFRETSVLASCGARSRRSKLMWNVLTLWWLQSMLQYNIARRPKPQHAGISAMFVCGGVAIIIHTHVLRLCHSKWGSVLMLLSQQRELSVCMVQMGFGTQSILFKKLFTCIHRQPSLWQIDAIHEDLTLGLISQIHYEHYRCRVCDVNHI